MVGAKKLSWKPVVAALTGGAVLAGVLGLAFGNPAQAATVERVVDGDTVDVRVGGETVRVRLLNVDAPETKHPGKPVECLGLEASEWMTNRLPVGTEVTLSYDEERTDRYDRTLAVIKHNGESVGTELARAGLGMPVVFGANDQHYAEVQQAWLEAEASGAGAFDEDLECTLPAIEAELAAIPAPPSAAPAAEADVLAELLLTAASIETINGIVEKLESTADSVYQSMYRQWDSTLTRARKALTDHQRYERQLNARKTEIENAKRAEQERLEKERREAERLERERAEQERQQKEREEAERRAAAERPKPTPKTQPTTKPVPQKQESKKPQPKETSKPKAKETSKPAPKKKDDKYTGPRCYEPGGKDWRPC